MFNDVVDWFLSRAGDRRQYRRRSGAFHLWCLCEEGNTAKTQQGIGLEISANGIMFLLADPVGLPQYSLIARLRDRNLRLDVRHIRSDEVEYQGKTWQRHMGEFTGTSAANWDAIARYVNDEPEPERRKMQNQEMGQRVDDAYDLLPAALQKTIVDTLVSQKRLEAPREGQTPLLKLFYGGLVKRHGEIPAHRFNVHSRLKHNDDMIAYDTRFLISEDGSITIL
ncbi:MAG: hypothetical protein M3N13_10600 [Candidatus Eremiobacteraeota bacterium]|nr:hypothetical protein [Candidatus Eremiobacteraeota bacterium]